MDKFAGSGLTPLPATAVKPPLIAECPVNIECRVIGIQEIGEQCDPGGIGGTPPPDDTLCKTRCFPKKCSGLPANTACTGSGQGTCPVGQTCVAGPDACTCPKPSCGNGFVEKLSNNEQCDNADPTNEGDCPPSECRPPGDPAGECTCVCATAVTPPNAIVWEPATSGPTGPNCTGASGPWPNCNPKATTRSLRFTVTGDAGSPKPEAIKVTMVNLQDPIPPNSPANPPQNWSGYESATCAPMKCGGGTRNGLTCTVVADCPKSCVGGTNAGTPCPNGTECLGGGTCPATTCTAAVESNGCARWVGKLGTFYEAQGPPVSGPYKAARLQCTPYYHDWKPEGLITVIGAEIAPSSEYSLQTYGSSCDGSESTCTAVSAPVTMYTRRSGDVELLFNPPSTSTQPNATDIAQLVNAFKHLSGAPVKAIAQLQPNLPELNADISALDIAATVDAFKGRAYPYSGPCPRPSTVTCGSAGPPVVGTACADPTICVTTYGNASTCVRTCVGGTNAGDPCVNNTHCPGTPPGTCGNGFCRDRCGRCTP